MKNGRIEEWWVILILTSVHRDVVKLKTRALPATKMKKMTLGCGENKEQETKTKLTEQVINTNPVFIKW